MAGLRRTRLPGQVEAAGPQVLAPVRSPKDGEQDRYTARPTDSVTIAAWRQRMGTDPAKETYRRRAATIECVTAQARSRFGVQQLRVRGLRKVRCVAQWIALTHNLLLWIRHVLAVPPARRAAA